MLFLLVSWHFLLYFCNSSYSSPTPKFPFPSLWERGLGRGWAVLMYLSLPKDPICDDSTSLGLTHLLKLLTDLGLPLDRPGIFERTWSFFLSLQYTVVNRDVFGCMLNESFCE